MPNNNCLHGRIILIVQRVWMIAIALATEFEEKGAQTVLVRSYHADLFEIPNLAASVLSSHSRDLCRQLETRRIPFVLYTGHGEVDHQCSAATVIQKPQPVAEVVARVEELLA